MQSKHLDGLQEAGGPESTLNGPQQNLHRKLQLRQQINEQMIWGKIFFQNPHGIYFVT